MNAARTAALPGGTASARTSASLAPSSARPAGAPIAMFQAARAHAFMRRRGYVSPEDVKAIAPDVLRHRVMLNFHALSDGVDTDAIVAKILTQAKATA